MYHDSHILFSLKIPINPTNAVRIPRIEPPSATVLNDEGEGEERIHELIFCLVCATFVCTFVQCMAQPRREELREQTKGPVDLQ